MIARLHIVLMSVIMIAVMICSCTREVKETGLLYVSNNTVNNLKKISKSRRDSLAANINNYSVRKLNNSIPEINDLEVLNSFYDNVPNSSLKIVAWNMERGRHWREAVKLINEHPSLNDPDFILLGEMDLGMARSANEHTTRELAKALKMNYVYGVEFLELTNGEKEERETYPGENEWGYHGNAILSKYPLEKIQMVRFPGIEEWYNSYQQRLGGRMALFATVSIGEKKITIISTHLESGISDKNVRYHQMNTLLEKLELFSPENPVIIGGDINASYHERLFSCLRHKGFLIEECNEIGKPTQQILKDGHVVLTKHQNDYIFVRDLQVIRRDGNSPLIVPAVYPLVDHGKMLGDHAIVTTMVSSYMF